MPPFIPRRLCRGVIDFKKGIKETILNIISDFILPIVAFTATALVLRTYSFHPEDLLVVMSAVLFLYIFTNLSGWLAYRRRKREFMR